MKFISGTYRSTSNPARRDRHIRVGRWANSPIRVGAVRKGTKVIGAMVRIVNRSWWIAVDTSASKSYQ